MLTNFLSNKNNLTILQCLLYGVLGYLLKDNYTWTQFIIVFVIILGIQIITHIRAISIGMMMNQLMHEEDRQLMKFLKNLKRKDDSDDELPN